MWKDLKFDLLSDLNYNATNFSSAWIFFNIKIKIWCDLPRNKAILPPPALPMQAPMCLPDVWDQERSHNTYTHLSLKALNYFFLQIYLNKITIIIFNLF